MGNSHDRNELSPTGRVGRRLCHLSSWGLASGCAALWVAAGALMAGAAAGTAVLCTAIGAGAAVLACGSVRLSLLPSYRVFRCRAMTRAAVLLLAAAAGAWTIALHPTTLRSQMSHFEFHRGVVTGIIALTVAVMAILLVCVAAGEAWEERRQERQWTSRHRSTPARPPFGAGRFKPADG